MAGKRGSTVVSQRAVAVSRGVARVVATAPHGAWHGMAWYGIARHGMAWHGIVR